MSVPITLKTLFRVVLFLQPEKFCEARVAAFNLVSSGITMVRKIVCAFAAYRHVDESPEGISRTLKPFGAVNRMEVEDRAGIGLFRPRQEAFIIPLDKTHRAINQVDSILAEIFSHLIEETLQRRPWDVDLSDHLSRGIRSMELGVDCAMIIVRVDTQLVNI